VAAAVAAVAAVVGVLLTSGHPDSGDQAFYRAFVDVGPADDLPAASGRVIETATLFVMRGRDDEVLAFARRAPKEGCRLVLARRLDGIELDDAVFFHDPCHGENFDRDGNHLGGPGLRSMYRYPTATREGRIIVDTSLAEPGALRPGAEGGQMSLDRLGVASDAAARWREALESAGAALQGRERAGPFVWALGAFQSERTGVITVDFTIDGVIGELQVGPPGIGPDIDRQNVTRVELTTGTLFFADAGDGVPLHAVMRLPDGRDLRLGVMPVLSRNCSTCRSEVIAPTVDELAMLIDRTVADH
jgi:nitrite reductase/ring-hydroxylating ferredoxin subunit